VRQKTQVLRQKAWVLQQNVKIYLLVFSILACAWLLQKKSYGRLFADYQAIIGRLPII
jgi:drug/metabolite transporter superfamily protein YnfA